MWYVAFVVARRREGEGGGSSDFGGTLVERRYFLRGRYLPGTFSRDQPGTCSCGSELSRLFLHSCLIVMLRATTSTRPATPAYLARSHVSSRRLHVRAQTNVFEEVGSAQITENQLQAQRYVAMNRFQTQGGGAPARFEQRWANRPSRLAKLKGFKYFSLLRSRCYL